VSVFFAEGSDAVWTGEPEGGCQQAIDSMHCLATPPLWKADAVKWLSVQRP